MSKSLCTLFVRRRSTTREWKILWHLLLLLTNQLQIFAPQRWGHMQIVLKVSELRKRDWFGRRAGCFPSDVHSSEQQSNGCLSALTLIWTCCIRPLSCASPRQFSRLMVIYPRDASTPELMMGFVSSTQSGYLFIFCVVPHVIVLFYFFLSSPPIATSSVIHLPHMPPEWHWLRWRLQ